MSTSVLLSAQRGKYDPSIALNVRTGFWCLLRGATAKSHVHVPCPMSSYLGQQEEEKRCSEQKGRPFYACFAMPSGLGASWRAVPWEW